MWLQQIYRRQGWNQSERRFMDMVKEDKKSDGVREEESEERMGWR